MGVVNLFKFPEANWYYKAHKRKFITSIRYHKQKDGLKFARRWLLGFWVVIPCSPVDRHDISEERVASVFEYAKGGTAALQRLINLYETARLHLAEDNKLYRDVM
jgi:hypothetical protein